MIKKIGLVTICVVCAAATAAGCGIAKRPDPADYDSVYNDDYDYDYDYDGYEDYDDYDYDYEESQTEWDGYYHDGKDKSRKSILTDPSDYEPGGTTSHTPDPRFQSAELMYNYEGRTFSSYEVNLEFKLTDVSANGDEIQVVFDKCQYPLSGIDLGTTYTGYLADIDGDNYVSMDGLYVYEIPFMDLWEDGSRHEDTFTLSFSFGSTDSKGEFALSKIGLLNDCMYMQ